LRKILCVVGTYFLGDLEFGTQERGSDLCDEFFSGISFIAKAFAEFSVEAMLRAATLR
jgi:hypothetical protein